MSLSVERKVVIGFRVALVVLVTISIASYRGVARMQQAAATERHSTEVLTALVDVHRTLLEAESGQRGYLLTGDSDYLAPYRRAVLSFPPLAARLQASVQPQDSLRTAHVLALAGRKLDELASTVVAQDRGDHETALAIVRTERGRTIMDSLVSDIGILREAERGRLDERQAVVRSELDRVGLVITLGVLLVLAVLTFGRATVARDERARERARVSLEKARDAAESASHAKSDFLARMSHELRTPLNAIIGFSGVLLRNKRKALDAQELSYLTRIKASGTQLLTIINDILDLAKVESGRMDVILAPVDLLALVQEIADSFVGALVGREVVLALDLPAALNPVKTDVDKLRQVLVNLLANALKFTERGTVLVRVVADSRGTHAWRLDVIDAGIGVTPSRQNAIFGAFEQGENSISRRFGGTGLGLAISKSICDRLGLGLTVVSQDGVGSTFSILFDSGAKSPVRHEPPSGGVPIGGPASEAVIATRVSRKSKEFRTRLVLIIDDSADARLLLTQYVDDLGIQSIAAVGGEQGVQMAMEFHPDLILLDLEMPEMNGWEVIEQLRAHPDTASVPIVIVSVRGSDGTDAGMEVAKILTKPVDRDALHAAIKEYINPAS